MVVKRSRKHRWLVKRMKANYFIGFVIVMVSLLIIYGPHTYFLYQESHPKIGTYIHKENISVSVRDIYIDYTVDIPCWGGTPGYFLPSGVNVPDVKWTPVEADSGWKFITIELELASNDGETGLIGCYLEDETGANIRTYRPECELAKNSTYSHSDWIVPAGDLKIIHLIYKIPSTSVPSKFHYSIISEAPHGNGKNYIEGFIYLQK